MRKRCVVFLAVLSLFSSGAYADENSVFWDWFQINEARYYKMSFDDTKERDVLFDELSYQFKKMDENLAFEFGKLGDNRMDFVISAGGIESTFSKVLALVNSAPKLSNWKFTAFRQKKDDIAEVQVGDIKISGENTLTQLFRDGDRIGVVLYLPGYEKTSKNIFEHIGFLLLDQTLGEYTVGTRVGFVEFEKNNGKIDNSIKLSEIQEYFK